MLQVKCIRSVEEMSTLAHEWDTLVSISTNDSFFLTWTWVQNWIRVYLKDSSLLCLAVYHDDNLVGVAPLWIKKTRQAGLFRLRCLQFIGSEEVCGDHLDLIVSSKGTDEICAAIWNELYGPLRSEWDIWEYHFVPAESPVLHALYQLSEHDIRCLSADIVGYSICLYIDLPAAWELYSATINSKKRRSLRVSTELVNQAGEIEFLRCEERDQLPAFMQAHVELHNRSWHERGMSGSFSTAEFTNFHNQISAALLDAGKLFFYQLKLNKVPIASFYAFEYDKKILFYLPGIDRSAVPGASIIKVMLSYCIEAAINRGCKQFDFLRGFEAYKYDWTDKEKRELLITFHNSSFGALVFIARGFLKRFVKQASCVFLGEKTNTLKRWLGRGPKSGGPSEGAA